MTPVDQEFIAIPEIKQYGDCQRAVIASLLDLPISEVPHFLQVADGDAAKYWMAIHEFLAPRGVRHVLCFRDEVPPDTYHEISGPSPRGMGLWHAVVGFNGEIVHDPHPTRAGLLGDPEEWRYAIIVPLEVSDA